MSVRQRTLAYVVACSQACGWTGCRQLGPNAVIRHKDPAQRDPTPDCPNCGAPVEPVRPKVPA
jgi:hypothetical protein